MLLRAMGASSDNGDTTIIIQKKRKVSIAILGGGITGLSCASQLLSQHKQQRRQQQQSEHYDLEVTIFDTGRLRPGGRCSSRLPEDVNVPQPAMKNRSSGTYPTTVKNAEKDTRSNRRACDNATDDATNNINNDEIPIPLNIQRAISSNDEIVIGMGPVDHSAQILSIPSNAKASFDEFQLQLKQWHAEGVIEMFPKGSVCELSSINNNDDVSNPMLAPLNENNLYYGKGGMGSIPLSMRQYCLSFNGYGENYTGQSFRILQDVWVSPSNGVRYIGPTSEGNNNDNEGSSTRPLWELWNGKKSFGKYDRLVIAHNGKCADRIMSRTPAKAFHSLLRTQFAPYVPSWGGNQMTLNSIYSLVFAIKSPRIGGDGNNDELHSPIAQALSRLSHSNKNNHGKNNEHHAVYTVMIKNEPNLQLLSCNTVKHQHQQNTNSESNTEIYTLLSSPIFGKKFKGPQENLPSELISKVVMKLLNSLERSLNLEKGSVVTSVVDLKLQLWGAAVPVNTWSSTTLATTSNDSKIISHGKVDGFVYDSIHGVGACGDWIMDSSIAGSWESGRRLANWLLATSHNKKDAMSVGLPKDGIGGKFVPSLGSGIGTIPSSCDQDSLGALKDTSPPPRKTFSTNGSNVNVRNNRKGNNKGRLADRTQLVSRQS
jgi:hypothetical protein